MVNVTKNLIEAKKKCHCSLKGISDLVKGAGGKVADSQETEAQIVVTVELAKTRGFEKLEKAINSKFPDHLRTVTQCGPDHASVAIWKN